MINAGSRRMNPTLSESVVARAYERDPQAAASEFGLRSIRVISGALTGKLAASSSAPVPTPMSRWRAETCSS